jgi:hypothetical protein
LAKGDIQSAGRKRRPPENARVAKRCRDMCACDPVAVPEGVVPLNPGFFALETMRAQTVANKKLRATKRGKVRSR